VQSQEEFRQYVREYEELKRQMEEDSDREILTLKTAYERKLHDEKVALHVRSAHTYAPAIFVFVCVSSHSRFEIIKM